MVARCAAPVMLRFDSCTHRATNYCDATVQHTLAQNLWRTAVHREIWGAADECPAKEMYDAAWLTLRRQHPAFLKPERRLLHCGTGFRIRAP